VARKGELAMNDLQRRWLEKNRIGIIDEVNRDMFVYVREAIAIKMGEGGPPITVHISSGGGAVVWGLDIYDLINFYPGKKVGVVHSMAASMASIILQACDWRTATPYASVLIHHVNNQNLKLDVARDKNELEKFIAGMEKSQSKLYEILVRRTGKPMEEISARCKMEESMTAQEALNYHLIDQIVVQESDVVIPEPEKK